MPDFPPTEEAPLSSVSEVDIFNGIKVRAKLLAPNLDAIAFGSLLEESLKVWTREERTGVWVFVPNPKSSLIPAALDQGFDFHHAKPGYAALIKWIGPGASMIPRQPFASVGVGAVIFNQREELLCVMEKNGPTAGRNMWKIPTGSADPGENIGRAAEREVWEETQIEAKFDKLLLFRQRYPDPKRNTDLYFVCSLKLENPEIQQKLVIDTTELEDAKWMPFKEYLSQPCWKENSVYRDHINPVIELYKHGKYNALSMEVGGAASTYQAAYGNHAIYSTFTRAYSTGPKPNHRLPMLQRPLRSGLNLIRRLSRMA